MGPQNPTAFHAMFYWQNGNYFGNINSYKKNHTLAIIKGLIILYNVLCKVGSHQYLAFMIFFAIMFIRKNLLPHLGAFPIKQWEFGLHAHITLSLDMPMFP
jgi:hypothetical protein